MLKTNFGIGIEANRMNNCTYAHAHTHTHTQISGKYRMHLKSTSGPINVLVLNQEEDITTTTMVPTSKCPRTDREHTHARQTPGEGGFSCGETALPMEVDKDQESSQRRTQKRRLRQGARIRDLSSGSDTSLVNDTPAIASESDHRLFAGVLTGGMLTKFVPQEERDTQDLGEVDESESPLPVKASGKESEEGPSSQLQHSLETVIRKLRHGNNSMNGKDRMVPVYDV